MEFVRLSREVVLDALTSGFEVAYLNVYPQPTTTFFTSDNENEYFSLHAQLNDECVPSIFSGDEEIDSLENPNYFSEFEYISFIGDKGKMSRAIVGEYEDAQWYVNRDAEHDARGTALATAGIFRPSY